MSDIKLPNLAKRYKIVLLKLAELLNENNLNWALGGSMLLAFHGLTEDVNDIDILVEEKDALLLKKLLQGPNISLRKPKPKAGCISKFFMPIVMDGVEVDIIGGFTIHNQTFPLKAEEIEWIVQWEGIPVKLHSLLMWELFYRLMERPEKANIIKEFMDHL